MLGPILYNELVRVVISSSTVSCTILTKIYHKVELLQNHVYGHMLLQCINVCMGILFGCMIYIMICYDYFLIFLLYLFTLIENVSLINRSTQILFQHSLSNFSTLLLSWSCFIFLTCYVHLVHLCYVIEVRVTKYTNIVHYLPSKSCFQWCRTMLINTTNVMDDNQLRSKNIWDHMLTEVTRLQQFAPWGFYLVISKGEKFRTLYFSTCIIFNVKHPNTREIQFLQQLVKMEYSLHNINGNQPFYITTK